MFMLELNTRQLLTSFSSNFNSLKRSEQPQVQTAQHLSSGVSVRASKTRQESCSSKTQVFIFQFTNAGSHHQHSGTVKKIQLYMYIEKGRLLWAYKNNYQNSNDAGSLIRGRKGTTDCWEDTGEGISWQVVINNCSPTAGPNGAEPGQETEPNRAKLLPASPPKTDCIVFLGVSHQIRRVWAGFTPSRQVLHGSYNQCSHLNYRYCGVWPVGSSLNKVYMVYFVFMWCIWLHFRFVLRYRETFWLVSETLNWSLCSTYRTGSRKWHGSFTPHRRLSLNGCSAVRYQSVLELIGRESSCPSFKLH